MVLKRCVPLVALALLVSACGASGAGEAETPAATRASLTLEDGLKGSVVKVESANTFIADFGGVRKSVRLVNTAAPSQNGVSISQNCLVEESRAALAEKLPEGTEVTLNFDDDARGSTGYVEAAVYVGETFINWEMARAGMVATTFATAEDEFYLDISNGQQDAANEGVGLYSKDVECTIPAALEAQRKAVEDARSWDVPAEDAQRQAQRETVYREASELYNKLHEAQGAPSQWAGSIVTLDAITGQLEEMRNLLGDDLYGSDGSSVNQMKKQEAETAPARPGS